MNYPPGKAPLAILIMALVSGALLLIFPAKKTSGDIELWTFAQSHYDAYRSVLPNEPERFAEKNPWLTDHKLFAKVLLDEDRETAKWPRDGKQFQRLQLYKAMAPAEREALIAEYEALKAGPTSRKFRGLTVDLQYVHRRAVESRLRAMFASDLPVPDLLETEISTAGTFFLGPLEDIGFRDLTEELNRPRPPDGKTVMQRVVRSRFAPYTSRGRIFGIPHDVHPVLLAYRKDIFDRHGVDAEKLETWVEFIAAGRTILQQMNSGGEINHYLMELSESATGELETLLFQRDGGYFDKDGAVRMDDEIAVQNMLWYVPLVAGPGKIGNTLGGDWELIAKSAEKDYFLAVLMPDWKTSYYQKNVKCLHGKVALMPLPAFEKGGRRTSTGGGTMMGFPKKSPNFEKSWELALDLYFNQDLRIQQFKDTNILPPNREVWAHPALSERNPYWSSQPVGTLYASQADSTPPQYASPYVQLAKAKMGEALCDCVKKYKAGIEAAPFEEFVRKRLASAADEIKLQMKMNPYQ